MELIRINYKNSDINNMIDILSQYINKKQDIVIVNIGTDKCIGDTLGPLVGTLLQDNGYYLPLYGTLDNPVHAVNLEDKIKEINTKHPNSFIIAIDACLGHLDNIGNIYIQDEPLNPGKGVGKSLPSVGNIAIKGIVDSIDMADIFSMRTIRLNLVMNMAKVIAQVIMQAFNIDIQDKIACCI
jgi:putative sporulation protein YyaC